MRVYIIYRYSKEKLVEIKAGTLYPTSYYLKRHINTRYVNISGGSIFEWRTSTYGNVIVSIHIRIAGVQE